MTTSEVNGHSIPPVSLDPVIDVGVEVVIDPKRLGIEGHRMLASIEAVQRWAALFGMYGDKAIDLAERRVLSDVVEALNEDIERMKLQLTRFAMRRGAAKLSNPEDEGAQ